MALDGATDRDILREHVRQAQTPTLRPGDIVILDTLAAHEDAVALVHIEAAGAMMPFPPPLQSGY